MIIARLQGGLGNQLFQYAAAKSLSERLQCPFKLETITSLKKDRLRRLALDDFELNYELASEKELKQFLFFPSLYRHQPSFFSKLGKHIYREPKFFYDPAFEHLSNPVYLDGFWQSPRYFSRIAEVIRKEFTPKPGSIAPIREQLLRPVNYESIAVHIRRGDFLNPKAAAYHGVLGLDYYQRAIALVKEKVPNAVVHYFSDDIRWVEENLPSDNAIFISSFTNSAIEDFYLMTKCDHNIIANSSFSWWTAWLNDSPRKIVVAPKNWFADTSIDTSDLIPQEWLRV